MIHLPYKPSYVVRIRGKNTFFSLTRFGGRGVFVSQESLFPVRQMVPCVSFIKSLRCHYQTIEINVRD